MLVAGCAGGVLLRCCVPATPPWHGVAWHTRRVRAETRACAAGCAVRSRLIPLRVKRRWLIIGGVGFVLASVVVLPLVPAAVPRPERGSTLEQFRTQHPQATDLRRFRQGDSEYVAIDLPVRGALRSGPAIYIFDGEGVFVVYTRDSGDDPDFWKAWPGLRDAELVRAGVP